MVVLEIFPSQENSEEMGLRRRRNGLPNIFEGLDMNALEYLLGQAMIEEPENMSESDINFSSEEEEEEENTDEILARLESRRGALADIFECVSPAERSDLFSYTCLVRNSNIASWVNGYSSNQFDEDESHVCGLSNRRRHALADIFQSINSEERCRLLCGGYTCLARIRNNMENHDNTKSHVHSTDNGQVCNNRNVCYAGQVNHLNNSTSAHFRRSMSLPNYEDIVCQSLQAYRRRNGVPNVREGLSKRDFDSLRQRYFYKVLVSSI